MGWKLGLTWGLFIGAAIALNANCASAQITPDNTLPNNSSVKLEGNTRIISGGTQAGSNLFHSFSEFSVPTGATAFFNNALDIQNIISRVTGKSISNIDGLIRANGTANLFLINPNGIIFGSNASLNIGGSFFASTASAVKFADGTQFSATAPQTIPLLTISVPIGLQYGGNAGSILNQSQATNSSGLVTGLQVRSGNTLALVGGDVKLDGGNLQAPGGRVELGGLSGAGTIGINIGVAPLRFPDNVARADVSLINGAEVNVRAGGGGSIAINAQNLNIAKESLLRAGIASGNGAVDSKAGNIEINATGAIKLSDGSIIANVVQKGAVGNGGDINIQAESISSTDGSKVIATTFGRGDAGNVTINARDTVSFDEEKQQDSYYSSVHGGVYSRVEAGADGHGGNIKVSTGSLSITNGAVLTTSIYGQGDAGNVYINARDTVSLNGEGRISKQPSGVYSAVNEGAIGQAGNLNVTANSLTVTNGATLDTSTSEKGNGGNITIDSGSFSLRDGAQVETSTYGQGNAGNVTVHADDSVSLTGANILSTVRRGGIGKGGNIDIKGATLSLIDGAELRTVVEDASNSERAGRGDAGNVNINVTGAVDIARRSDDKTPSGIFSYLGTGAVGNGGNITIDSGSFSLRDRAVLLASTYGQGNAGNVTVHADDSVSLTGANIVSTVGAGGIGKGGNIDIKGATLSLTDGAELRTAVERASNTQPAGRGDAGNINVNVTGAVDISGRVEPSPSGIFSYLGTGAVGNGGNITIDSGLFSLQDRALLQASTYGQGNAGNVTVHADDSVSLTGANIVSTVGAGGIGKGGNIDIKGATLLLTDGAELRTAVESASNPQPAGQGDAGNINVNATGAVDISGRVETSPSGIFSYLGTGAVGNGGNITIDSGLFSLRDRARLLASTFGQGNAGNVTVRADNSVSLTGANIVSTVGSGGIGKGGNVNITAGSLSVTNGAELESRTYGRGDAGSVNILARDRVSFDGVGSNGLISGAYSTVETGALGNGGDINIKTGFLSLSNRAGLFAQMLGKGTGGSINIKSDALSLSSNALLEGDLDITGQGRGANINLDVTGTILLAGGETASTGESTRITLGVLPGGIGSGGDLKINAGSLVLKDGAIIKTSSQGQGKAGNIQINADIVDISGSVKSSGLPSGLFSSTDTTFQAGDIIIDTRAFQVADGAALSARSRGDGQGGNIRVNATNTVALVNGGQLVTTTFGKGQAGNITVNALDRVSISGRDPNYANRIAKFPNPIDPVVANAITQTGATSGLFANTQTNSTGQGGGINITARQLIIEDGAKVTVNSQGLGNAGSIEAQANSMRLSNGASFSADTAAGQGNINLRSGNLILRRGSSITTRAKGSNITGGNIIIDTDNLVAVPKENSDISADSVNFRGGNVRIKAQGIFGTQFRSVPTSLSDITATGANSELSGTVQIITPDINPSNGLVNLPSVPVDTSVAQSCTAGGNVAKSEFIITGPGGLPSNPNEALSTDAVQVDLVTLKPEADKPSTNAASTNPTSPTPSRIVEATGWTRSADGNVVLTANLTTATEHSSLQKTADCRVLNQRQK